MALKRRVERQRNPPLYFGTDAFIFQESSHEKRLDNIFCSFDNCCPDGWMW
jgi:hypothetical protein